MNVILALIDLFSNSVNAINKCNFDTSQYDFSVRKNE